MPKFVVPAVHGRLVAYAERLVQIAWQVFANINDEMK